MPVSEAKQEFGPTQEDQSLQSLCNQPCFAYLHAMWEFGFLNYPTNFYKNELEQQDLKQHLLLIDQNLEQAVRERYLTDLQRQEIRNMLVRMLTIANQFANNNFNTLAIRHESITIINANNEPEQHQFTALFESEFNNLNHQLKNYFHDPKGRNIQEKIQNAAYFVCRNLILGSLAVVSLGFVFAVGICVGAYLDSQEYNETFQRAWGKRSDIKRIAFSKLTDNIFWKSKQSAEAWIGKKDEEAGRIANRGNELFGAGVGALLFRCQRDVEKKDEIKHIENKEAYVKKYNPGFSRGS